MQAEQRRWCRPICGVESLIPVSMEDPMACAGCAEKQTAPGIGIADPNSQAEVQRSQRALDAALAESELAAQRHRRNRRRSLVMASAMVLAAFTVLVVLRPYSWGQILVSPPRVQGNLNENAPLVTLLEFSTRVPASALIEISDGERKWTYRPQAEPRTEHKLAVLGLRPNREHVIRVQVESSNGWFVDISDSLRLVTPPLPEDFPPLKRIVSRPGKMEPGVTLFAVNHWLENKRDSDYGYIMMLDEQGEVIWYYRAGRGTADMRMLSNGNLLCNVTNYRQMYELDFLGNVHREWQTTGVPDTPEEDGIYVDADTLHHEILELPSGNFLALSTELRRLDFFPSSETDPDDPPTTTEVVGDVIVEFEPDGEIVKQWHLFDMLDPQRIGYGTFTGFWAMRYDPQVYGATGDWSHANAMCYDPQDDSMIVSLRHQDALVKIDRQSDRIVWILGDPKGWREPWSELLLTPVGELQWPYHQHAPRLTPHGTILMYDNGNYRAVPFDPQTPAEENRSRVVEFRVDGEAMTVEQVWEYRGSEEDPFYSPFYCEADWLPGTGNILITDGGRIETEDGTPSDEIPTERQWARVLEVTREEPVETVFEVVIDSGMNSPLGWSVYRSERLPDVQALSDLASRKNTAPVDVDLENVSEP